MKFVLVLAALCLASPSFAGTQQNKMKECNAQAKGKKGDERKAFMKECLSNKPVAEASAGVAATPPPASSESTAARAANVAPPPKANDPKQRMKDCNAQAKGKKGDERKAFMSTCLKN